MSCRVIHIYVAIKLLQYFLLLPQHDLGYFLHHVGDSFGATGTDRQTARYHYDHPIVARSGERCYSSLVEVCTLWVLCSLVMFSQQCLTWMDVLRHFAGRKEVETFVRTHPNILSNVPENVRIQLVKTKVFNERKQRRNRQQQGLQQLSRYWTVPVSLLHVTLDKC